MERLREVPWGALDAAAAVAAIDAVLAGAAAEREVDRALRSRRDWSRNQRRALAEAIFGVALWRRRLAWHVAPETSPAALLTSLLRDLGTNPQASEITGVAPPQRAGTPERLADRWSLPDWLERHLEAELGAEAEAFCEAVSVPGPVCLRANRLLCTREALAERLKAEGIETTPAPRAPDALIVTTHNPNLFGSAAWRDGWFEAQDEGSQVVGALVAPRPGETVLDLCAGAGGKSLQLAAQGATVLAHDIDQERLARLRTRAVRARAPEIRVVDRPQPADHVLVDAPCSELGILRRGPDSRWRIDPRSLQTLPATQRQLLEVAAEHAKRRVIYVTCTLNRGENEDVASWFEAAHPRFRRAQPYVKLTPHRDGTDGFFAAAWERIR